MLASLCNSIQSIFQSSVQSQTQMFPFCHTHGINSELNLGFYNSQVDYFSEVLKTKEKKKSRSKVQHPGRCTGSVSLTASFSGVGQASLTVLVSTQSWAHKYQIQGGLYWDGINLLEGMLFLETRGSCACWCLQAWSQAFLDMHNSLQLFFDCQRSEC